jgi:hypothetical protein
VSVAPMQTKDPAPRPRARRAAGGAFLGGRGCAAGESEIASRTDPPAEAQVEPAGLGGSGDDRAPAADPPDAPSAAR